MLIPLILELNLLFPKKIIVPTLEGVSWCVGVEVSPDLVRLDDDGGYQKLRLLYFLTVGEQYAPKHYAKKLQVLSDDGGGVAFKPDADKRLSMLTLLKGFQALDILPRT